MKRFAVLLALVMLLAGCNAESAATADRYKFDAKYAAVAKSFDAISLKMTGYDEASFQDPAFRAEIVRLAQEWRTASNALRYMPKPAGEKWDIVWPMITDAMSDYAFVASILESAARENSPLLLLQAAGRIDNAKALLKDAFRLLGDK